MFTLDTTECVTPVFAEESYDFEVPEDVALNAVVGTVMATDPNDDAVTYSITTGNEAGKFGIGSSDGAIAVSQSLDYEETQAYTLTVQASDPGGNTGTATVEVAVSDVLDTLPPAPTGVDASLAGGHLHHQMDCGDKYR